MAHSLYILIINTIDYSIGETVFIPRISEPRTVYCKHVLHEFRCMIKFSMLYLWLFLVF